MVKVSEHRHGCTHTHATAALTIELLLNTNFKTKPAFLCVSEE